MSGNATPDSLYSTPVARDSRLPAPDPGASPDLAGTTRSGKRRAPPSQEPTSRKTKARKMVTRTPNKTPVGAAGPSTGSPTERSAQKSRKAPSRDEDLSTSDLAAIMTDGLSKMMAGMNKLECQISGRIDTVQKDVASLDTRFKQNAEDNNRRLEKLERLMGQAPSHPDQDRDGDVGAAWPGSSSSWPSLSAPSSSSSGSGHSSSGLFATAASSLPVTQSSSAGHPTSRKERNYWKSRRSLYLWPVKGPDLPAAVLEYVRTHLEFDAGDLGVGDFTVEKMRGARSKKKFEVLVRFNTVDQRDAVRAAAYLLAGSEAGMKIDIPDSLKANFRHLDSLCFTLKKKHPELKRAIKYDDDCCDLYADIQIKKDSPWRRIEAATARVAAAGNILPDGSSSLSAACISELLGHDPGDS